MKNARGFEQGSQIGDEIWHGRFPGKWRLIANANRILTASPMKKNIFLSLGSLIVISLGLFACSTSRAGYESAPYTVVEKDGDVELRDYPQLTVARTAGKGTDADGAFMRLFRYIQGDNAGGAKIEMTTPVFMERGETSTEMSFVMPKTVAAGGAPAPKASEVTVSKRPAGRYAVLRFSGSRSQANEQEALGKLREWMKARDLKDSGAPTFAYFDPPWTPSPMRRNEVMLPIVVP
jgi:DNA gyrase inhibitor GyrI